jgi:hypothetical protein
MTKSAICMKSIFVLASVTWLCAIAATTAMAQSPSVASDTVVWEVDQFTDQNTSTTEAFSCKFITTRNEITWLQRSDAFVNRLRVGAVTGQWPDLSVDGSIEFEVTFQDRTGRLRFERTGGSVLIKMYFMEGDRNSMPYVFHVDRYFKQ